MTVVQGVRAAISLAVGVGVVSSTGCSAFQPATQVVTIDTPTPGAQISVDGTPIGVSPLTVSLRRDESHSVMAWGGDTTGTATINTHISTTGVLDIIGTFFFIVPVIGVFTPGFRDLDATNVAVPLNR